MLVLEGFVPLCIRSGLWRRWWSILLSNGPQRPSRLRSNHHHRSACLHADLWLLFRTKAQKVIRQAGNCRSLQSANQKQYHLLELSLSRQAGREGTKRRSQRKLNATDRGSFAHVMGPHQHARRIRFLRGKAQRYTRNYTPEKGSINHTSKRGA